MKITSDMDVRFNSDKVKVKAGTQVTGIVDFAGQNKKRHVDVEPHLIKQYGGERGSWKHTRGEAEVIHNGTVQKAELHWFESKEVGQVGFKVKRILKENDNES